MFSLKRLWIGPPFYFDSFSEDNDFLIIILLMKDSTFNSFAVLSENDWNVEIFYVGSTVDTT